MYRVSIVISAAVATTPIPFEEEEYTTGYYEENWTTSPYEQEEWGTYRQEDAGAGFYNYTTVAPDYFASYSPPYDVCGHLCDDFSANGRGNGYDLCDSPQQSRCVYNVTHDADVCTNLYWSFTEEGGDGIVYETDASGLTDEEFNRPVWCADARHILYGFNNFTTGFPQYGMYEPQPTNPLNIALDLFIHSHPGQVYVLGLSNVR